MDLIEQGFSCRHSDCEENGEQWGFIRREPKGGFYRFPPVIGKQSDVDILFVGINPRRTNTNRNLHELLMKDERNFRQLAHNIDPVTKEKYISSQKKKGREEHYDMHAAIVASVYEAEVPFEEIAAVTELFLCASKKSKQLKCEKSPCVDKFFLQQTLPLLKPKVIIPVGKMVEKVLKNLFDCERGKSYREVLLIPICHPNARGVTNKDKEANINWASKGIKLLLEGKLNKLESWKRERPELEKTSKKLKGKVRVDDRAKYIVKIEGGRRVVYQNETTRVHFRQDCIEQLVSDNDLLVIDIEEIGIFRITRKELYEHPKLIKKMRTPSYKKGDYHQFPFPRYLEQFLE